MVESDWMLIRILSYKIARLERCKRQHSSLESPLPVMQTTKSSCEIFAPPLGSFFPFFFFSLKWAFHFPDCLPRQLIPLISPATGGCELSQMWEHLFCMAYTRTSSRETYSLGVFFFFFSPDSILRIWCPSSTFHTSALDYSRPMNNYRHIYLLQLCEGCFSFDCWRSLLDA